MHADGTIYVWCTRQKYGFYMRCSGVGGVIRDALSTGWAFVPVATIVHPVDVEESAKPFKIHEVQQDMYIRLTLAILVCMTTGLLTKLAFLER